MNGGFHDTDDGAGSPGGDRRPALPAFAPIGGVDNALRAVDGPSVAPPPVDLIAPISIVIALLLITAWTGFFIWSQIDILSIEVRFWPGLIAEWATPVLLIGAAWLITSRGSSVARLDKNGGAIIAQAERLDALLITVNRELSLAREFIAAQARDLESIGRLAAERLTESGARIEELVLTNAERIDVIAGTSRVAIDNLEQLRAQLPVLTSATRDLGNTIGSAGQTSQAQLAQVHQALAMIGEAGATNAAQINTLRQASDRAIAALTQHSEGLASVAAARFEELRMRSDEARAGLDMEETQALAALRSRTETLRRDGQAIAAGIREGEDAALGRWREASARAEADIGAALVVLDNAERDAFAASHQRLIALSDDAERVDALLDERARSFTQALDARRRAMAEADDQAVIVFTGRLAELDAELATRQAEHVRQGEVLTEHADAMSTRLVQSESRMTAIVAQGRNARDDLATHLRDLIASLADGREALSGVDGDVRALITSSERVRDLLGSAAALARDEVPFVLADGEAQLRALHDAIAALRVAAGEADELGGQISGRLVGAAADASQKLGEIGERQSRASADAVAHLGHLEAIDERLGTIIETGERLSDQARDEFAETLSAIVRDMTASGASAFDRALRNAAAETSGRLEQAAAHAAGVGGEAAHQLRTEIAQVERQTAALEARVAAALARTEAPLDRDFARRAALITETLNSNAIDIASALAHDLPDSAWAAYLRGDRGIFTRRAVRLLDGGQSRAIVTLYEAEPAFRDHVSRYIQDFEAILRELLSARDGHVLAVTMLSSDLGKLYVALAQAIERLRQ